MTTSCAHDRRVEFIEGKFGRVRCRDCNGEIVVGDGRCKRCKKPLDDTPHVAAVACS